ncbi:MAG TPA: FCD domain-containing protein [Streptosporangiaceae bacterium]
MKRSDLVVKQIVRDIVHRGLGPGSMLPPEATMLREYGVSRSSLREALRILEVNGLIVIKSGPGGGPCVASVEPRHFGRMTTLFLEMGRTRFREVFETRMIMEPLMTRLAAERRHPEKVKELNRSLQQHAELDPTDELQYLEVVQGFHSVVAGLSGNRVLDLFGRSLEGIFSERVARSHQPAARWRQVREEHEAIGKAILDGDADLAESLMRTHMRKFAESFERRYGALLDEIVGWV